MADARRPDVVQRTLDAIGAAELAGVDGDAEARLAGDLESPQIVVEMAVPLVAGDAEPGHQRMPERAAKRAAASIASTPTWRMPMTIMRLSMPVLALALSMPSPSACV